MKMRKHSKTLLSALLTLCIMLSLTQAAFCADKPAPECCVGEAVTAQATTYKSTSNAVVSAATTASLYFSGTANYGYAYDVLDVLNEHRQANGLDPLTMDTELLETAMQRSAECVIYYSHTRPDGSTCFTAFPSRFGNSYRGENIAIGYLNPEAVMEAWKNSPGHNENMLNGKYTSVGIGCFYHGGTYTWAQVFSSVTAEPAENTSDTKTEKRAISAEDSYLNLGISPNVTSLDATAGVEQEYNLVNKNTGWGYLTAILNCSSAQTSDSNVAVVTGVNSETGAVKVKALNEGSTTLTIYTTDADGNTMNAELSINVTGTAPVQHVHTLAYTPTKEATCTSAGNTEYWSCSGCGKHFSDAYAEVEIVLSSTTIKAKGHDYQDDICTRCGAEKPNTTEVHFERQTIYFPDQFDDVGTEWFAKNVSEAFELGLMKGTENGKFSPGGNVTLAQAITMAARIHSIYTTGSENFVQTGIWYQVYLDYAYENGIISYAYYNCDVDHEATRAQFAEIFGNSMPDEGLYAINDVPDNAIPDVSMDERFSDGVYKLYRAGILTGHDSTGRFAPTTYINRAEAAAIVSRMAESDNRQHITIQ